jgi:hypothetical protein
MSDEVDDAQDKLDYLLEDLRLDAYCPCDFARREDDRKRELQKLRGQIGSKTEVL